MLWVLSRWINTRRLPPLGSISSMSLYELSGGVDVNAIRLPSGDHAGELLCSRSPSAVMRRGGLSGATAALYKSIPVTPTWVVSVTKATDLPSGEMVGQSFVPI